MRRTWALAMLLFGAALIGGGTEFRSLNGNWRVLPPVKSAERPASAPGLAAKLHLPETPTTAWKTIKVPHYNWHEAFPDTYPDASRRSANYQFTGKPVYVSGWFDTSFDIPAELGNRRVYLDFGSVAFETELFVNGRRAASHKGSFTGFEVDVTPLVKPGSNTLRMWVANDFGEHPPRHVYGKMFSASSNSGGITGNVTLKITSALNVRRMLLTPLVKESALDAVLELRNHLAPGEYVFRATAVDAAGNAQAAELGSFALKPGENRIQVRFPLRDPKLWSPADPQLYRFDVEILDRAGKVAAKSSGRFGFRDFRAVGGKFCLNGERIRLYAGNILTSGGWERTEPGSDAKLRADLRRQKRAGVNAIRYHMGGSDSHRLLAIADEEGLLVIDEFPMFHRVFSDLVFPTPEQRKEFMDTTLYEWRERIFRDYNHPSAVIWTLSNEVWTDSTADELNELYRALKPLDPMRPFNTGSGLHSFGIPGVPVATDLYDSHLYNVTSQMAPNFAEQDFDRYFRGLEELYGGEAFAKPAAVFESVHVGHNKPEQLVPLNRKMGVEEYLKELNRRKRIADIRWYGLRAFLAQQRYLPAATEPPGAAAFVNAIVGDAFDRFRADIRFQGYHLWTGRRDIIYPAYSELIRPYYVGVENWEPNVSGGKLRFGLIVVNDSMKARKARLELQVFRYGEQAVDTGEPVVRELALPEGVERSVFPMELEAGFPGFCELRATLTAGDCKVERSFPFFRGGPRPEIRPERRMAKWDNGSGRLRALKLPELRTLSQTGDFEALVVSAADPESAAALAAAGGQLAGFVKKGGKLLLLNLPPGANLNWILPGYSVKQPEKRAESASTIMELADPDHPVFAGLSTRHFQAGLNGDGGVVGRALLYPLSVNLLGTGFPYNPDGPGMLIAGFGIGEGSVTVSQVELLERLDGDPAAAALFANLVNDTGTKRRNMRPMAQGEANPLLEHFARIPAADCFVLPFEKIANRSFTDDPSGVRGWTGAGLPDFRQGPRGDLKFHAVPYRIPADGRALILRGVKTPAFPEKAEIIFHRPEALRSLVLFHTAWYPARGKELYRVILHYADGGTAALPVVEGRDIGDWYAPFDRAGAAVAFQGKHPLVQASFGFYASILDNPEPFRRVKAVEFVSDNTGVPILLAAAGVRFRDWAEEIAGDRWDHRDNDFEKSFGVRQTANNRFILTRGHGWIAPALRGREIDGTVWNRLRFALRSTKPLRVKLLYQSSSGDNGVCRWLEPVAEKDGWSEFDVELSKLEWPHSSSPEAKAWGGRTGAVSMFAVDLYGDAGTEFELSPLTLTAY